MAYTCIFRNVSMGKSLRNMQRQLRMSYIVTMLNNIQIYIYLINAFCG